MLVVKLAFRNIIGAGVRTWLNAMVLSIVLVAIIWCQGFIIGMNEQIMTELIETEYGGGQYWSKTYDPYDPLTVDLSHAPVSTALAGLAAKGEATPVLISSGALIADGRAHPVLIKGVDPDQKIVKIPAHVLRGGDPSAIPALIGARMAGKIQLNVGDFVTVRWRDVHGTFDAADIRIVHIMRTNVPVADNGVLWIPLEKTREMLAAPGEASLVVLGRDVEHPPDGDEEWIHRDMDYLLKDLRQVIETKTASSAILYALLLSMALLAIFDTQVLAIFRRRKEMGTLMALGMTRGALIGLFTLEGALHGVMAVFLAAVHGVPLLYYSAKKGFPLPEAMDDAAIAIPDVLYPSFGPALIVGTTLILFITVTLVSLWPARKIATLKPTDALRGVVG